MYEVTFFKSITDHRRFAVTPDSSGIVLPDPEIWERWFSQMVYPEQLNPASELHQWQTAFAKVGYFNFPDRIKPD
jgi:hypothetical protein